MATTPNLGLELTAANETSKLFSAYRNGMSDNNVASNLYKIDTAIGKLNNIVSNDNLLHNWDFRNPVNQQGQTEYTAQGYTLDRWRFGKLSVAGGVSIENGGITLYDQGDGHSELIELIEGVTPKTDAYTFSADISAFVQGSATNSVQIAVMRQDYAVNYGVLYVNSTGIASLTVEIPAGAAFMVGLFCYKGASMTVKRAKLELGTVSTLANDPPADYGKELLKCKRLAQKRSVWVQSILVTPDFILFDISHEIEMRLSPTVDLTNSSFVVDNQNGTEQSGFSFSKYNGDIYHTVIKADKTSHGCTSALLRVVAFLSADL